MTKPEVLQHPNIPKPLHGLAPRVILGQDWWDKTRQEAYASTDYHCIACGIHKTDAKYHRWLEAHEDYTIDYEEGIMKVNKIIPLCHSCHNFIHSGRLSMVSKTADQINKAREILKHGFAVLEANNLDAFYGTIIVAGRLAVPHNCKPIEEDVDKFAKWNDWKMIIDGKEYYSKFKDYEEWSNHYIK